MNTLIMNKLSDVITNTTMKKAVDKFSVSFLSTELCNHRTSHALNSLKSGGVVVLSYLPLTDICWKNSGRLSLKE